VILKCTSGVLEGTRLSRGPKRVSLQPHRLQPSALAKGIQRDAPLLGVAKPARSRTASDAPHLQLTGGRFDTDLVAGGRTRITRWFRSLAPLPTSLAPAGCSTVAVNGPFRVSRRTPPHRNCPANLILLDARPAGFEPATGGLEVRCSVP
jgi:hypothetical protein